MITVLSLFSGMGASERALENLNIEHKILNYCEINPDVAKAYSLLHNVPENLNLGDVAELHGRAAHKGVNLVTYTFPLDDITDPEAKRVFFDGHGRKTRGGLFFDALRIIYKAQPDIAIAETLGKLANPSYSPILDVVLRGLDWAGYKTYWKVLNARDYGIPQSRERIYLISVRKDLADETRILFPKKVPLTTCMGDFLEKKAPKSSYLPRKITDTRKLIRPVPESKVGIMHIADFNYYGNAQLDRVYSPDGVCPTLTPITGGGREIKIREVKHYRKLTLKEYFRLMGFRDEDLQMLTDNKFSYREIGSMIGNSSAVPVWERIFEQLYLMEDNQDGKTAEECEGCGEPQEGYQTVQARCVPAVNGRKRRVRSKIRSKRVHSPGKAV